jgi:xylulokinase
MYLGLDFGTSGVKAVITDATGAVLAQATAPLTLQSPHPLWREQDPEDWWRACVAAIRGLRQSHDLTRVRAMALSGQMHGAVLLGADHRVLRPAILWNDGRSGAECAVLEAVAPRSREITGNLAMPGFTAPKLLWVRRHEPAIFAQTRLVLLPKDWIRLRLCGEAITDASDAAGTLWLDVGARRWSQTMLAATGLSEKQMPRVVEGSAPGGVLRREVAELLGLPACIPIAGGGGDNAAGAVGIGCVQPGNAMLSLGTSGVIFVADAAFTPDPARAVHAFCHCLPNTWHRMSVMLSAAACLRWLAGITGADEATLLAELAQAGLESRGRLVFLPYLAGERTPHNNPDACGVFFGLTGGETRADLARAVLEGVAFGLADGLTALEATGDPVGEIVAIGGGAQAAPWLALIAAALDRTLLQPEAAEIGPALGAARLARIVAGDANMIEACIQARIGRVFMPDQGLAEGFAQRREIHRALYPALFELFNKAAQLEGAVKDA